MNSHMRYFVWFVLGYWGSLHKCASQRLSRDSPTQSAADFLYNQWHDKEVIDQYTCRRMPFSCFSSAQACWPLLCRSRPRFLSPEIVLQYLEREHSRKTLQREWVGFVLTTTFIRRITYSILTLSNYESNKERFGKKYVCNCALTNWLA